MTSSKPSVLVLGAGLSGLQAALSLTRLGYEVQLIEARERIGGRVFTKKINSTHIELGAEWIGSNDTRMLSLCNEFKLPLLDHRLTTRLFFENKYYAPGEWEEDPAWQAALEVIIKNFPHLKQEEVSKLKNIDWWHFLQQHHVPSKDMSVLDLMRSTDFGEDMRFVPAYDVLYDYAVGGDQDIACGN